MESGLTPAYRTWGTRGVPELSMKKIQFIPRSMQEEESVTFLFSNTPYVSDTPEQRGLLESFDSPRRRMSESLPLHASIEVQLDESHSDFFQKQALVDMLMMAAPAPPPQSFSKPSGALDSVKLTPQITIEDVLKVGPDHKVELSPVETENLDISSPIMSAVEDNEVRKVIAIIAKDPKLVNFKERLGGNTPLIRATTLNNIPMVILLLDKGADPSLEATKSGDTALHKAVLQQNFQMVEVLVERGADINAKNQHLATPLVSAIRNPKAQHIARYLIEKGADVQDRWFKEGYSPLMVIVEHGCSDRLLKMILDYGADINDASNSGVTALHLACKWGYLQLVAYFLLQNVNMNIKDVAGWNPLMYALCWGHHMADTKNAKLDAISIERKLMLVKLLLQQGADPCVLPSDGWTSVFLAIRFGPFPVLEYILLLQFSDINLANQKGDTALHIAANHAPPTAIREILKYKPKLNVQNKDGDTPLIVAVRLGGVEEAQLLLIAGADPKLKNKKKESAASLASKSNKSMKQLFKM